MKKKKNLFLRFVNYYKPHKTLFIIDMCCALIISVFNLIYPFITKEIINNFVPNKMLEALLIASVAILIAYAIKAILNFILQYWGHLVGVRMQADMRSELFDHLQKLPFSYFDDNKTGVIMSRMTNDLFEVSELAHHGPEDLFLSIITIVGSFIILCTINITLTLIVFAFVPIIALVSTFMRGRFSRSYKRVRVVQGEINADIESAISGIRVSRAYNSSSHEKKKFDVQNKEFVEAKAGQYKVMGQYFSSMTFLLDLLYFVVLLAGGLFYYYEKIDIGEFAAYILYISTLTAPIRTLVTIYEQIQAGATGFKRFCEIMDEEPEEDSENAVELKSVVGEIEFNKVSFSYKSDEKKTPVINNFSLKINAGKTVALVGPSGGGKTTICHLIPRFYEIDEGQITIDGHDIRAITRKSLRNAVGIVQQDVFLFNGTIKENIAYGNFEATDEEIVNAAKKANIHAYIAQLPQGYETSVGERGIKLSGGQKQRISIARAFLKNPAILILDEATSALDNATEMQIQESLYKLMEGRTTVVVAHRLSTIKNSDEIIVLTNEGIAERGTHEQLLELGGLYKTLYDYQFKNL